MVFFHNLATYLVLCFMLGYTSFSLGKLAPFLYSAKFCEGLDRNMNFLVQIMYNYVFFPWVSLCMYYDHFFKKAGVNSKCPKNITIVVAHCSLAYLINYGDKSCAFVLSVMFGMIAGFVMFFGKLLCDRKKEVAKSHARGKGDEIAPKKVVIALTKCKVKECFNRIVYVFCYVHPTTELELVRKLTNDDSGTI